LTRAFGEVEAVPTDVATSVSDTIMQFSPDLTDLRLGTERDGVVVPALVRQLRAAASPNATAVHTGVTSQDIVDTALSLTLRETNTYLQDGLNTLETALQGLSRNFGQNQMMGRTRMQAAMPIHVADRLATWSTPLPLHRQRLEASRGQVEHLQLGGSVGTRAAFGANADAIAASVARQLDLTVAQNTWHVARDGIADFANALSLITGSLGKMGQDICLMAQQGIDEIEVSGGGRSSAMPHKQNPVLPELLVTLARFNATQISAMHYAVLHEQERSGAAWSLEWMILPQMAQATARSLSAATEICGRVTRIGA